MWPEGYYYLCKSCWKDPVDDVIVPITAKTLISYTLLWNIMQVAKPVILKGGEF